jgi:methyl-accepting chemotaxis protein
LGGEPYAAEVMNRMAEGDLRVEVTRSSDKTSMLFALKNREVRRSPGRG